MRVIHMDSGLGNQMLDYAEYLAIKEANPDGEYYQENSIHECFKKNVFHLEWI